MSFKDKTIVITGGAKGIGAGCTKIFHQRKGNVVVLDIDAPTGEKFCRELGGRALFIQCDVSDEREVEGAIKKTVGEFGSLDVLVNNAGIMQYCKVTETTEKDWDKILDVNLKGAFLCAKHAIPHMVKEGAGIVINMSSVQAFVAQEELASYVTSKSALIGLTHSIAVDYAPQVRSVTICPGGVDTPLNREAFRQSSDPGQARQETIDLHLTGRMAQPDDIGELVAFVASEEGSFINGQPIRIDGGMGIKIRGSKKD